MNYHDYLVDVALVLFGLGFVWVIAIIYKNSKKEKEIRDNQDKAWDSLYDQARKGQR